MVDFNLTFLVPYEIIVCNLVIWYWTDKIPIRAVVLVCLGCYCCYCIHSLACLLGC